MAISRPDDLGDIVNLGITLSEAKQHDRGFSASGRAFEAAVAAGPQSVPLRRAERRSREAFWRSAGLALGRVALSEFATTSETAIMHALGETALT